MGTSNATLRRNSPWVAALALLAASAGSNLASGEDAADGQRPVPVAFAIGLFQQEHESTGRAFLNALAPQEPVSESPIVIQGQMLTTHEIGRVVLTFGVHHTGDDIRDVQTLSVTPVEGATPFRFEWYAADAPDGDYVLSLELGYTSGRRLAWSYWNARKRSRPAVEALRAEAYAALTEVESYLKGHEGSGRPRSASMLALCRDALVTAESKSPRELLHADANARFVLDTIGRVRVALAFHPVQSGIDAQVSQPAALSRLQARGGGFLRQGRPVFLAGLAGPAGGVGVERLQAYGFNFAGLHADAGGVGDLIAAGPIAQYLAEAEASGIATAIWLDIADLDRPVPVAGIDGLAREGLTVLSLWTQPRSRIGGPDAEAGFVNFVTGVYADRHELNRVWKRHLLSYDEIGIWPGYENRAYQYDWQTYQRRLMTERIMNLTAPLRAAADPLPITLTMTDRIVKAGETRYGIDQERLSQNFPIASVRTAGHLEGGLYAQQYPHAQLVYAVRRSFAPDLPLVALHVLDLTPASRYRRDLRSDMRTFAFEAAMSGVAALALEFPGIDDPVHQAPELLAGLSQAKHELDAYAGLLASVRQSPAPVAILWSDSSKILDDGRQHLASVTRAFEGCSSAGHRIRFLTERQLAQNRWDGIRVLVIPDTPAVNRDAFAALQKFVDHGVGIVRTTQTIAYDERGRPHTNTLSFGPEAVLVRGGDDSYEYLEAMDEIMARGLLPNVPRAVNAAGYPLEGVKTRYIETLTGPYLYLLNLREGPVLCHLTGHAARGRDVLTGSELAFPRIVPASTPMLLQLTGPSETIEQSVAKFR